MNEHLDKQDNRISSSAQIDERLKRLGIPYSHRELRDRWVTLEGDRKLFDVKIVGIDMFENLSSVNLILHGIEDKLEILSVLKGKFYGRPEMKIDWG